MLSHRAGLFGLLLIAAALLPFSAHAQSVTAEIQTQTQSVISDQIKAFQSKDYVRAFSHAAPTIRNLFRTEDNFINMVKGGYQPLYDPQTYQFGRNFNLDGTIHQEVIVTDQSGKQWQAVYTLKEQPDGSWKITGVKMNPFKGATT